MSSLWVHTRERKDSSLLWARVRRAKGLFPVFVPVVALMLTAAAYSPVAPPSAQPPPKPVLVYGDSIISETTPYLAPFVTEVHSRGGSALCEWIDTIAQDVERAHPRLVVVSFIGNDCPWNPGVSFDGQQAQYAQDVQALKARIPGTLILWVLNPVMNPRVPYMRFTDPPPNDVYAAEPLHVDAGARVEDNGAFGDRLTCRADESSAMGCASGTIRVRADDGGHLCTANGVAVAEYCSGARRFSQGVRSAL
jgi:hypothetical protein